MSCDQKRTLFTLGILLSFLGLTSVIIGAVEFAYQIYQGTDFLYMVQVGYRFYDQWAGVTYIIAGSLGIATALSAREYDIPLNRKKMIAFLITSTVAAVVAPIHVNGLSAIGPNIPANLRYCPEQCTLVKLMIASSAFSCAAFILSVVGSVFALIYLCTKQGSNRRGDVELVNDEMVKLNSDLTDNNIKT